MEPTELIKAVTDALKHHVAEERQQVGLLRRIDRLSIDATVGLDGAINAIERQLNFALRGKMSVALVIEGEIYSFRARDSVDWIPPSPIDPYLYQDSTGALIVDFARGVLCFRIRIAPPTVLVIALKLQEPELSAADVSFITQVADQLHLLATSKINRLAQEKQRRIVKALLTSRSSEFDVWSMLLEALVDYPPDWCPGKRRASVTQFLIARRWERTMHLVAGEGSNSVSEFVLMNESLTGRAVLEGWKEARVVETETEAEKFVSYTHTKAHFALVVPIVFEGETIAVLNLETSNRNQLNSALASFYSEASEFMAPIVATILERNARNRQSEIRLQYVLSDMLQKFGGTFGHLISQPFLSTKLTLGEVKYLLRNEPANTKQILTEVSDISRHVEALEKDCLAFVNELPNFLDVGPKNVEAAIRARLRPLRDRAANHNIKLRYKFEPSNREVFGSSLFAEHVFNICFNSFQQILGQMEKGEFPHPEGKINITSKYVRSVAPSGDWKGVDFVTIVVADNGGGMSPENLEATRFGHTTKIGGNGYAIPAAIDYFSSMGGTMDFSNHRDGLRTIIRMQAYSPDRHHSGLPEGRGSREVQAAKGKRK
jgi:signal transduction histidine kinase